MEAVVAAATKLDYQPALQETRRSAGRNAALCYMNRPLAEVFAEPEEKTLARAEQTMTSGHHSVEDHYFVTIVMTGIPKFGAMLLNSMGFYTTSEKSARYTKMEASGRPAMLYAKWRENFQRAIEMSFPDLTPRLIEKKALENARYFIPVFTPATTMSYTCSIRQLNYMLGYLEDWMECGAQTHFERILMPVLRDLYEALLSTGLNIPDLRDPKPEGRFPLLATRPRQEMWGEVYSVNYTGSMAQLAQAHRHRTLHYEMIMPGAWQPVIDAEELSRLDSDEQEIYIGERKFFVPPILPPALAIEYIRDMNSIWHEYPQGMLVMINERGTVENFRRKFSERVCGQAQLEVCLQTVETTQRFYEAVSDRDGFWYNPEVATYLDDLVNTTGCKRIQLSNATCPEPCWWICHGYGMDERTL